MKNKTFYKELLRTIKNTKTRFLSIFVIIALGVGFFAGINATEPDMIISADNFYKENKLSDLTVLFPLELKKEDKTDILIIDGVSSVEEKIIKDVLIEEKENSGGVLRLYNINEDIVLDKPYIVEGNKPKNENEILLDVGFQDQNKNKIGDKVNLYLEDEDEFDDTLKSKEYTISGFALSPKYVSFERGQTNIGSGSISYFGYLHDDAFKIKANNLLVTLQKSEGLSAYSDKYDNRLNYVEEEIKKMGLSSMERKIEDIKEELEEREKELEDAKKEAEDQFEQAEDKIEKAEDEITEGEKELQDAKEDFNSKYNSGLQEINSGKKDLEEGRDELEKNKNLIEDGKEKIAEGEKELAQAEKELEEAEAKLEQAKTQLDLAKFALESGKESLKTLKEIKKVIDDNFTGFPAFDSEEEYDRFIDFVGIISKDLSEQIKENFPYGSPNLADEINKFLDESIEAAEKEITEGEKEYEKGLSEYNKGKKEYDKGYAEFKAGQKELEKQKDALTEGKFEIIIGELKLEQGEDTLSRSETELKEGKEEFKEKIPEEEEKLEEGKEELEENKDLLENEKKDAYEKIEEGQEEIAKAYKDLEKIPDNWIITSRESYPGYSSYGDDARRMGAVAKVFPLFFFLVAALVSLTTMTRMVEEERTQIGTLKALGYKTSMIGVKYISYAFLASFFGSIVGFTIGFQLFPRVIMMVYGAMYNIPNHSTPFHFKYAVISTLIAVVTTVSATIFAIASEMKSMPAVLMQVKAPKPGKRIFLEKINFLWKRISFSNKVTARNVFRYKRRLFMTVLGIAGSMALLLTGFGIRDSVNAINEKQFKEIFTYDGLIFIDEEKDAASIKEDIKSLDEVSGVKETYSENVTLKSKDKGKIEVDIMVTKNSDNFGRYIDLHTRKEKDQINIEDGVVITEKLSSLIGKNIGDKVTYENKDGVEFDFEIGGISENYLMHYIYMNKDDFKKTTGEAVDVNSFMFVYGEDSISDGFNEDKFKEQLLSIEGVQGSVTTEYLENEFSEALKSLDYVVLILIISAGALSFIVLYNLTNINITERIREIATIKVLGFRDKEVSAYVYKENVILSVLGTLVGVILGIILHRFVMTTMEVDSMMFGKNIYGLSYLYSVVLSLSFTVIVNIVMHFKLKKVDMVESLKSVE